MDQLIPIASKLQDVLGALGQTTTLDLPQIVVVGGQSSGKSSVLESLVGKSFLPRGAGIVTRRPLILQLYNTANDSGVLEQQQQNVLNESNKNKNDTSSQRENSSNSSSNSTDNSNSKGRSTSSSSSSSQQQAGQGDEWGEFLHLPGQKFFDFRAIRQEIVTETERLTGDSKRSRGIDKTPIRLKVYSPKVLALTVVDLPGIAKVPVGNQPHDIEEQIAKMCMEYISNPNAIILAVTAANQDLANSDALKMAQAADPSGSRTVGVLTKLDLMDPGTDCADILLNQIIPLRRGYVAVVNRGQKDVASEMSIRDGFRKEEAFFRNHPVYSRDRSLLTKCGTPRLAKALNNMLMVHIRDCLPDLKHRITHMSNDVQQELEALGSPTHNTSRSARGAALLNLLSKFANNFAAILDGRGLQDGKRPGHSARIDPVNELIGGARISYIFTKVFAQSLTGVGAFDGLSDDEIRTTIANANGTRPALFVPEVSFDILVRRQVARLEEPGVSCVDLVYEELQRIAAQAEPHELTRFPVLRDRMVEVVLCLLRRCVGPTQLMVTNLVKIELAYVNTSHPDFIGGSKAVAGLMGKIGKENDRLKKSSQGVSSSVAGVIGGIPETVVGGATPLSSSSLNNYGYQDAVEGHDHDEEEDDDRDVIDSPSPYVNSSRRGTSNNNDDNGNRRQGSNGANASTQQSGGGIMSMLFNNNESSGTNENGNKKKPSKTNVNGNKNSKNKNNNRRSSFEPPSIVNLPQVPDRMRQTDVPPSEKERIEMEIIKSLVDSYFDIVRKNFTDMVPKTIMYFLVNHVRDSLQNELVSELYREAEVGTLLQEAEDIASRRQTCMEMKDLLSKALEIVNEVRDFNSFK